MTSDSTSAPVSAPISESKQRLPTLIIAFFLIVVTIGVFSILKFGYTPAPVVVMKPSYFATPEEIGAVLFRRFFSPIEQNKRVFVGIPPQPEFYRAIVVGMIQTAELEKHPFDVVIAEEEMPRLELSAFKGLSVINLQTNTDSLAQVIDLLNQFSHDGKHVLVYLPSIFSTHALDGNFINRVERTLGTHELSISATRLALRPDQEYLVDPPCLGSERDVSATAKLGCLTLESGRHYYRKKIAQDRWVAIMDAPKPDDYLLMVSVPDQDKGNDSANQLLRMDAPPAAH